MPPTPPISLWLIVSGAYWCLIGKYLNQPIPKLWQPFAKEAARQYIWKKGAKGELNDK